MRRINRPGHSRDGDSLWWIRFRTDDAHSSHRRDANSGEPGHQRSHRFPHRAKPDVLRGRHPFERHDPACSESHMDLDRPSGGVGEQHGVRHGDRARDGQHFRGRPGPDRASAHSGVAGLPGHVVRHLYHPRLQEHGVVCRSSVVVLHVPTRFIAALPVDVDADQRSRQRDAATRNAYRPDQRRRLRQSPLCWHRHSESAHQWRDVFIRDVGTFSVLASGNSLTGNLVVDTTTVGLSGNGYWEAELGRVTKSLTAGSLDTADFDAALRLRTE